MQHLQKTRGWGPPTRRHRNRCPHFNVSSEPRGPELRTMEFSWPPACSCAQCGKFDALCAKNYLGSAYQVDCETPISDPGMSPIMVIRKEYRNDKETLKSILTSVFDRKA